MSTFFDKEELAKIAERCRDANSEIERLNEIIAEKNERISFLEKRALSTVPSIKWINPQSSIPKADQTRIIIDLQEKWKESITCNYDGLFYGFPHLSNVLYVYNKVLKQEVPSWFWTKHISEFERLKKSEYHKSN